LNAAKRYTDLHRSTVQRVVLQASFLFCVPEKINSQYQKRLHAISTSKTFFFVATHF
jgi:hypothetical protein